MITQTAPVSASVVEMQVSEVIGVRAEKSSKILDRVSRNRMYTDPR